MRNKIHFLTLLFSIILLAACVPSADGTGIGGSDTQQPAEHTQMTLRAGEGFEVQISPSGGEWVYFQIDRANPLAISAERPFGVRYTSFDGSLFEIYDGDGTIFFGQINSDTVTVKSTEQSVVRFRQPQRQKPQTQPLNAA